jgi:uncharacterized membrane protein
MSANTNVVRQDHDGQTVWMLRRNCSLTPKQLVGIFGSLAGLSLAFAAYWASRGAWVVVPFAVAECLALGVAFLVYARHACDHERVVLSASGGGRAGAPTADVDGVAGLVAGGVAW